MSDKKILVVDDEPVILNVLEGAFSKVGYLVYPASNANEAFAILNQEKIYVMFIDLGLESTNGFKLCENIRRDNPRAIIYALTGYAGFYDPKDFLEAGFDGYFDKPVNIKILFNAAKEAFDKLDRSR